MTYRKNNQESPMASMHWQHIDVFKGIVILLVIVGHIVQNSLTGGGREHPLYLWIYTFHMPAFFFCSGFLNKANELRDIVSAKSYIIKKVYRILIPYLIWGIIMFFYSQKHISINTFVHYIVLRPGYGLWFLQALFKFCILSVFIMLFINRILQIKREDYKVGIMIIVLACSAVLSMMQAIPFLIDWNFVWFFLGMILRKSTTIYRLIMEKRTATILAVIFFASIFMDIPRQIISLTGIITILNISLIKFGNGKVIDWLICFGKNTMPIFLLHFFLLGKYKLCIPVENTVVLFFILMAISVIIALICIAVYRSLSFGYLPVMLWGDKNRN